MAEPLNQDEALRDSISDAVGKLPGFGAVVTGREAIDITRKVLALVPVAAAALCGSFSREEQNPQNDLGFVVSFGPSARVGDVERARFALEFATGRDVGIITMLGGGVDESIPRACRT